MVTQKDCIEKYDKFSNVDMSSKQMLKFRNKISGIRFISVMAFHS